MLRRATPLTHTEIGNRFAHLPRDARAEYRMALAEAKTPGEKLAVLAGAKSTIAKGRGRRAQWETFAKVAVAATREALTLTSTAKDARAVHQAATNAADQLSRLNTFHPVQAAMLRRTAFDATLLYKGAREQDRFDAELRARLLSAS